jgi:DNA segregation ATPase FtsK/SpoIIIE, S-DNA-T family
MADRRRYRTRARPRQAPRRSGGGSTQRRRAIQLSPQIARSLLGLVLLVLGAVTFVALLFPQQGLLTRYVDDVLRPSFGVGAWLLAALLMVAGVFVERDRNVGNGWAVTAIGGLLLFGSGLGLIHLLAGGADGPAGLRRGGGALGHLLSSSLADLLGVAGALVVLVGLVAAGLVLLLNATLRDLVRPIGGGGRAIASAVRAPFGALGERERDPASREERERAPVPVMDAPPRRGRQPRTADDQVVAAAPAELPAPTPSPAPISQTVWSSDRLGAAPAAAATSVEPGVASATATVVEATEQRTWALPSLELLDEAQPPPPGQRLDHQRNIRIIEEKLRSFQIPASVTRTNTGPVVTQYEVRPDSHIKLSRIEALADDLAMALAARSIRIEAPIPGKDVVGIEIPNHASEIVGFEALVSDSAMLDATSKLTFALGRDVSGKPYAVDLARMPHLLIAGATGSGKSVCVNALITSLLLRASPDELRLILVDLKRVELAPYRDLPHLLTDVIVEAHDARSALAWAVNEMEDRYRILADAGQRNITAYNASVANTPVKTMPFIVVVIDELADLMMREGRKVEDPVVKLAQKARAVGIHLVLATQRPSVNVVTGLIKANVPSRIAFAMASNVDSRTVLDAPGAEDLIGRGDMLYQPADLPRPVRLQGVFVSDQEVRAVTDFWRAQAEPDYLPALLESAEADDGDGGQFGWLAKVAEDELTARAAELVMQTGKASTSMMQTKLKIGFNRATRLMDELERFGIVGPLDPRNPAVPRQVFGPDNWLRGPADADLSA